MDAKDLLIEKLIAENKALNETIKADVETGTQLNAIKLSSFRS